MRLGLFIALLVALLAVVGLTVPFSAGPMPVRPGTGEIPTRSQCLALTGESPPLEDWLPPRVYLLPSQAERATHDGATYKVAVGPDSLRVLFAFSVWYPAGRDSVDIALYHSSVLRLPAHGRTRVGRLSRTWFISFFDALLTPDRVVLAQEVPCPPGVDVQRGDSG